MRLPWLRSRRNVQKSTWKSWMQHVWIKNPYWWPYLWVFLHRISQVPFSLLTLVVWNCLCGFWEFNLKTQVLSPQKRCFPRLSPGKGLQNQSVYCLRMANPLWRQPDCCIQACSPPTRLPYSLGITSAIQRNMILTWVKYLGQCKSVIKFKELWFYVHWFCHYIYLIYHSC